MALDYVANRIARGLASRKTETIGPIIPDVINPFLAPVVRGAETAARRIVLQSDPIVRLSCCKQSGVPVRRPIE